MPPKEQTKMEKYAELEPLIVAKARQIADEEIQKYAQKEKFNVAKVPLHYHNGVDSPKLSQANIESKLRAVGNITMATTGTRYSLGLTFNPTAVEFSGFALHRSGGIDIRVHVVGNAQLGPSYHFQPDTSTSVKTGGPIQPVIQSCSSFLIDSSVSPPVVRALTTEFHLVSVEYPGVVARATIPDKWGVAGQLFVDVTLAAGWEIVGNFTIT